MTEVELGALLLGWAVAGGSPGPTTLALAGTAMDRGRRAGLAIAAGIMAASASWGIGAGLGLSAIMLAHAWVFELIRYAGAAYLLYLAIKSVRSAWKGGTSLPQAGFKGDLRKIFLKGMLLHLTNPKAILSWGAVYAIALSPGARPADVWSLFFLLFAVSCVVFFGYGLLFSTARASAVYARSRRWFELSFAALFGAASIKILTVRLT